MKVNYHTHTRRCLHAAGTEADYVRCALEAGVQVLGFSDHAPFPDHDFGLRMPFSELQEYFSTVERLTSLHQNDIIIKKSLEIEYLPRYDGYYEWLISQCRTDYLILGEHFFLDGGGRMWNITTQTCQTEQFLDYARAVAQALKTGYFQILAHPDLFAMNRFPWDKNCDAATGIILEAAAETGTILEYNANGYRRGYHDYPDGRRLMYPHRNFWLQVRGSGIPVVIGSDCHEPQQVWDKSMELAAQDLRQLDITPVQALQAARR